MISKQRLSASVDADLVQAAERAVRYRHAPTVSAWVNDAMRRKLDHERRLRALEVFVAEREAEGGEITEEEMRRAYRRARARAVPVRPDERAATLRPRRRRG